MADKVRWEEGWWRCCNDDYFDYIAMQKRQWLSNLGGLGWGENKPRHKRSWAEVQVCPNDRNRRQSFVSLITSTSSKRMNLVLLPLQKVVCLLATLNRLPVGRLSASLAYFAVLEHGEGKRRNIWKCTLNFAIIFYWISFVRHYFVFFLFGVILLHSLF